jgi:predicted amidohydrolase
MQIALCQFNPTIGAVAQNIERILAFAGQAHAQNADLIIFPELALCGYPPKDLVFLADFIDVCEAGLLRLAQNAPISILIGAPTRDRFNAAYLCSHGKVTLIAKKRLLPNYQVFDEHRYFQVGESQNSNVLEWDCLKIGVNICEDAWSEVVGYTENPILDLVQKHRVDILVNMTASPFEVGKSEKREEMFCGLARKYQKPFLIAGQVGANDGLIFDGGSLFINAHGEVLWRAKSFEEQLQVIS